MGGGGKGPCRTAKELSAAHLAAYKLRYEDRKSYSEIWAELAGEPFHCRSLTTAKRWVDEGFRLVHDDEDGMTDPMAKRRVRREVVGDSLDALFVKIEQDLEAGNLGRGPLRAVQLRALESFIHLHGLRRLPEMPRRKGSKDGKSASVDPALLDGLAAMLGQDPDALIEALLPDGRTEP